MRRVAAFGTWPSPIDADMLVAGAVSLSSVSVVGPRVWWVESRPSEAGRQVLVSRPLDASEEPRDNTPPGFSVRSSVHEYGGRCYVVADPSGWDPVVVFSNWEDQRLWAVHGPSGRTRPLTPNPPRMRSVRYADPVVTNDGSHVICVRESHLDDGVVNDVVAVPLWSNDGWLSEGTEPTVLAGGHDFYAAPRISPDGRRLAWITWDDPDMPWDSTCLWVATLSRSAGTRSPGTSSAGTSSAGEPAPGTHTPGTHSAGEPAPGTHTPGTHTLGVPPPGEVTVGEVSVGEPTLVAGGPDESVTQPRWSPAGLLHYLSDRSGWWNVYDEEGRALTNFEAEVGEPDWVFGNSTYGFDPSGSLIVTWSGPEGRSLGWEAEPGGGLQQPRQLPFSSYSSIWPIDGGVACIAGSPTLPPAVVRIDRGGEVTIIALSRDIPVSPGYLSSPRSVDFPTGEQSSDQLAHALVYEPASEDWEGPAGALPPLIVIIHGGPTSQASRLLNLSVQYWTTRGFAVADVDYRGSSGYGRDYRNKLRGAWGVADVADCTAVVAELGRLGLADPRRAFIRGSSAGGFTTLAALAASDTFAAGASHYGVADLELLAQDTHKFEARYLDSLVGAWPKDAELYRNRSPLYNVERITSPLILFQGLEDVVVPPSQSQAIFDALRARGVRVEYLTFEGEQHGFRKAETIIAVYKAELAFYLDVLESISPRQK